MLQSSLCARVSSPNCLSESRNSWASTPSFIEVRCNTPLEVSDRSNALRWWRPTGSTWEGRWLWSHWSRGLGTGLRVKCCPSPSCWTPLSTAHQSGMPRWPPTPLLSVDRCTSPSPFLRVGLTRPPFWYREVDFGPFTPGQCPRPVFSGSYPIVFWTDIIPQYCGRGSDAMIFSRELRCSFAQTYYAG